MKPTVMRDLLDTLCHQWGIEKKVKECIAIEKWYEVVGVILAIGGLTQLVAWVLDKLGLSQQSGDLITFLISLLFTSVIIIMIILVEQYSALKKIKEELGMKEEETLTEKIGKKLKGKKKGVIDPRILLWILIAVLGYLFLKAIFKF